MNSDTGWPTSFTGFLDYAPCFETGGIGWLVIGLLIGLGAIISVVPQIALIISQRSSFGLNSVTLFITSFGQFILLLNIVCLRSADFVGLSQYPFSETIGRLMTFINQACLWLGTLPIVFLNCVFFDRVPRAARPLETVRADQYFNRVFTLVLPGLALFLAAAFAVGIVLYGIGSLYVVNMGKFFGTVAGLTCIAQYLPQVITTCKLKSSGSLSLILLSIQAPGGLLNSMFMAIGQGENWTTYISILATAIQQFFLLGLCLFFKLRKKRREDSESTAQLSGQILLNAATYH
jgi:uncharacterized protein with PQ loop repeat